MRELRDQLRAADLRAVLDGKDLNPPAIWLTPDRVTDLTGCGGELHVDLWLTVGDQAESRALGALTPMLADALAVLEAADLPVIGDITTELVMPASGGSPLPALKITTSLSV